MTEDGIDVEAAIAVDLDDRDFTSTAPDGAVYVLPPADISAKAVRSAKAGLKAQLHQDLTVTLHHNRSLKLWSRPGETPEAFAARCEAAADDGADADADKIRQKLEAKHDKVADALAKAEDRVNELEVQAQGRKQQQIIDIGASVLGGLLGGRRRSRGLAAAARRAASGRRQASSTGARLDSARNRVAEKIAELDELEYDLQEALIEIDDEWSTKATDVEEVAIGLEKSDIVVEDFFLAWIPVSR
ncbi:MAG: hypothetical protein AAGK32_04350 [Actinomycetota bacterium]